MKIEELEPLLHKVVRHKGAVGFESEKRYTVAAVIPKMDLGSRAGVGPAVVIVRIPHGTEVIRPGKNFLDEYEVAPDGEAP